MGHAIRSDHASTRQATFEFREGRLRLFFNVRAAAAGHGLRRLTVREWIWPQYGRWHEFHHSNLM